MLSKMTAYSANAAKMNMMHEISHVDIAVSPTLYIFDSCDKKNPVSNFLFLTSNYSEYKGCHLTLSVWRVRGYTVKNVDKN